MFAAGFALIKQMGEDIRFIAADHPFYQNVYKLSEKVNPKFAEMMDCCIDVWF